MKKCERGCGFNAQPGGRFCKVCETAVKREMKRDGYLQDNPRKSTFRGADAQENLLETKHGVDW